MINLEEILLRFISLLKEKFHNKTIDSNLNLNQYLDIGTATLSGISQRLLEKKNWEKSNWIDDILIRDVKASSKQIIITGNAIFGKTNTTKEWVSPILLQISFLEDWTDFINYEFYFGIKQDKELDYKDYSKKREEWNEYFDQRYSSVHDNWKYIISIDRHNPSTFL